MRCFPASQLSNNLLLVLICDQCQTAMTKRRIEKLADLLQGKAPTVAKDIRPGASEDEINRLASLSNGMLPPLLAELYRWSDGLEGETSLWPGMHWQPITAVAKDHA